jgi:hypothetical protein
MILQSYARSAVVRSTSGQGGGVKSIHLFAVIGAKGHVNRSGLWSPYCANEEIDALAPKARDTTFDALNIELLVYSQRREGGFIEPLRFFQTGRFEADMIEDAHSCDLSLNVLVACRRVSDGRKHSPVKAKVRAGDIRGPRTGEEDNGIRDLFQRANPPDRNAREEWKDLCFHLFP